MVLSKIADFIDLAYPLESNEEKQRRLTVTRLLETVCASWLHTEDPNFTQARLLTFGSSILEVVTNESDLDAVLLIPATITREKFFSGMVPELLNPPEGLCVDSVMAVPDAHVPVLKLVANGMPVDILPCRIPAKDLRKLEGVSGTPDFNLLSMSDLDMPSLLALNGVRVGRTLVDSIRAGRVVAEDEPIKGGEDRMHKYRQCLRVIKYWAKQRGVYGNALGFFGGVTWAILLVRVCLSADPSLVIDDLSDTEILARFFKSLHEQSWGAASPVSLRPLPSQLAQYVSSLRQATPNLSCTPSPSDSDNDMASSSSKEADSMWDPSSSETDRRALMPILTPVTPFMNSTFNVVPSTLRILTDEFRRAAEITQSPKWSLEKLCKPALEELLENYRLVLSLTLSSDSKRLLFVWKSLVESKLRVLLYHLERFPGVICRPFPCAVPVGDDRLEFLIALALLPVNHSEKRVIDFNFAVGQFHGALATALQSREDAEVLRKHCHLSVSLRRQ